MIPAYRLEYPESPHAVPQLWEYEQPYIHHLCLNARTFGREVTHRYFRNWYALARENRTIWETHYRCRPLYAAWTTWETWLKEYRQLVVEVQAIAFEHRFSARYSNGDH
jgi:hypothetical protein